MFNECYFVKIIPFQFLSLLCLFFDFRVGLGQMHEDLVRHAIFLKIKFTKLLEIMLK